MNKHTIRLRREADLNLAWDLICRALKAGGKVMDIRDETRSDQQNRLMWPLIADLREQDEHMATFTPDQVKLRFLNALDNEMQLLPELWGGGQFVVGQRSSTLSKARFGDLLELIFKWGAENDIKWSRKSVDAFREWRT